MTAITEHNPEQSPQPETDSESVSGSWAVSVAFWCALITAFGIYAAVSLAPKLTEWSTLSRRYNDNARELSALEEEVEYLERVNKALESDPQFVQRLVNLSEPETHAEGEIIPVSGRLIFGTAEFPAASATNTVRQPVWTESLTLLASHQRLRNILLIVAASITVFGFTFLNDAGEGLVRSTFRIVSRVAKWPVRRYFSTSARS